MALNAGELVRAEVAINQLSRDGKPYPDCLDGYHKDGPTIILRWGGMPIADKIGYVAVDLFHNAPYDRSVPAMIVHHAYKKLCAG